MSALPLYYPPGPASVSADLTRPDAAYRLRVAGVLVTLFLFLILYLVILAGAAYLTYLLTIMPLPETSRGRGAMMAVIFKFGSMLASAMLFLFLLKGLFKGQRTDYSQYVQLKESDQPQLFAFVRQLCKDTGAPFPKGIYVSPEVNAAVFYDTTLLNLFIPPRKKLLIGLGLVNVVNLSEFKAVLAHEFGHFSQKSVGFGSYVSIANRIIRDIVYARDKWDDFLDGWCGIDLRVSFPAWGLRAIVWALRKVLGGVFQALNLIHRSLGRQMEYNADNVAISVTGSDAIIHALYRLDFSNAALGDAAQSLHAAADHGLFSDDLFHHQLESAKRLRTIQKKEDLGIPPQRPADAEQPNMIFDDVNDGIPERWRTHPTEFQREKNAKRHYIPCPEDSRSPWLLFNHADELRKEVTDRYYRHGLDRKEQYQLRPALEVQEFINAEHSETTYDPRYHGFYDDRFIQPWAGAEPPSNMTEDWNAERAGQFLSSWPTSDLESRMKGFAEKRGEYSLLLGLKSGGLKLKGDTFPFRGQEQRIASVPFLFEKVDKELDAELSAFQLLDREVYFAHLTAAQHQDGQAAQLRTAELNDRYQFHLAVQRLVRAMSEKQNHLQGVVKYLTDHPKLQAADFEEVKNVLGSMQDHLSTVVHEAKKLTLPPLQNVSAGTTLDTLIIDRSEKKLAHTASSKITGEWIMTLGNLQQMMLNRLQRIYRKSLGGLLTFQEKLSQEFLTSANSSMSHP